MAIPTTKIVLKETTKMTLHERFSLYQSNAHLAMTSSGVGGAMTSAAALAMQRQASIKNQRLAVQMANRPTVVAALRLKKRSLKQRLGVNGSAQRFNSNVKARLAMGNRNIRNRLGIRGNRGGGGRGFVRPGTSPMLKARLGLNGQFRLGGGRPSGRARGGRGGYFNRLQQHQQQNPGRMNTRGRGRWQGGSARGIGGARGGGARGGRGGAKKLPTKQDLDNDIDQYMAQTKMHLDHDLDAYMAQTE